MCLSLVAACAGAPHVIARDAAGPQRNDLEALLAAYPLPPGQNLRVVRLSGDDAMSVHLAQIRDRESPHLHATHDLTVTLLRGHGELHLAGEIREMHCGDVAIIPRATPHYFVNAGSTPAVAFVTFAPSYDGTDQVPVQ